MLSILIPTYNYNIFPLVCLLQQQAKESGITYEIIVLDDGSNQFQSENEKSNALENCSYELLPKNIGRTAIRNLLAQKATFSWLLFLDADVLPVKDTFIKRYISYLKNENKVIVGGYQYQNTIPEKSKLLRYKYGKMREEKLAIERNLNPYNYIFSGNILIQKNIFLASNYNLDKKMYGMDIFFASQLFDNKISILHIDNPIFHLGLESNTVFFQKALEAVKSRKYFLSFSTTIDQISPLIYQYKKIERYKMKPFVRICFKLSEPVLKKMILHSKPNLFCFDLYRLGYFCSLQ